MEYNLTIQHYRGRNEHLISEMKQSRETLSSQWTAAAGPMPVAAGLLLASGRAATAPTRGVVVVTKRTGAG